MSSSGDLAPFHAGMEYLHAAGILHGDLKPANVLLKSTSADRRGFLCKLCDFGMSRLMDATQATHVSTQTYGVSYALGWFGRLVGWLGYPDLLSTSVQMGPL